MTIVVTGHSSSLEGFIACADDSSERPWAWAATASSTDRRDPPSSQLTRPLVGGLGDCRTQSPDQAMRLPSCAAHHRAISRRRNRPRRAAPERTSSHFAARVGSPWSTRSPAR
jgi:hypothetical protein